MRQILEYIAENDKMAEYQSQPEMLQYFIVLIMKHNVNISNQFDSLNARIEDLENYGSHEVQQILEHNCELEGELENLDAEIEKMRVYEKSYHV